MKWQEILDKYAYKNTYPNGEEKEELKKTEVILEMFEGKLVEKGLAIRRFCLDCAGGSTGEVALCHSFACSLYPFRFGTNTHDRVIKQGIDRTLYKGRNNYRYPKYNGRSDENEPWGDVSNED